LPSIIKQYILNEYLTAVNYIEIINVFTNIMKTLTSKHVCDTSKTFVSPNKNIITVINNNYYKKEIINNYTEVNNITNSIIENVPIIQDVPEPLDIPFQDSLDTMPCSRGIDMSSPIVIDPIMIKNSRIFVLVQSVIIQSDITSDGIEIILLNNSINDIRIRDPVKQLQILCPHMSVRMIYVSSIDFWIID
jgi:hypothetical protein